MHEDICPVCGGPVVVLLDSDMGRVWIRSVEKRCACPVLAVMHNSRTADVALEEAPCDPEPPTLY